MIESMSQISDLLEVSRNAPIFRTIILPCRDASACVDYYQSFGFTPNVTRIEGLPRDIPTVSNEWHTLVFFQFNNPRPHQVDCLPSNGGSSPYFLCSGGMHSFTLTDPVISNYALLKATDPDGRQIIFAKRNSLRNNQISGMLCWIDLTQSFVQRLIRSEVSGDMLINTLWSFPKQSAFIQWTESGQLPSNQQITTLANLGELDQIVSCLKSITEKLNRLSEDDISENRSFYRFCCTEGLKGWEIQAPLSVINHCLHTLPPPLRKLLYSD